MLQGENDIAIFVKYYSPSKGRCLTLKEILDMETTDTYHEICAPGTFLQYEKKGIVKIENTPEEIEDAIQEMVDRLDGTIEYTEEDVRLQKKYRRILDEYPMKKNYPFGVKNRCIRCNDETLQWIDQEVFDKNNGDSLKLDLENRYVHLYTTMPMHDIRIEEHSGQITRDDGYVFDSCSAGTYSDGHLIIESVTGDMNITVTFKDGAGNSGTEGE